MRAKPRLRRLVSLLLGGVLAGLALPIHGACPDTAGSPCHEAVRIPTWPQCGPPPGARSVAPDAAARAAAELTIDAGRAEYGAARQLTLTDGFEIARADQRVSGVSARFDGDGNRVLVDGEVRYREAGLEFTGRRLEYRFERQRGSIEAVEYTLPTLGLRGHADRVTLNDARTAELSGVSYSSCAPGDDGWVLDAARIELDRKTGWGEARDAVVRLKGVPVLYAPWLPFPIDDRRKSGLLPPRLGFSDHHGLDLAVPWYWNLAPNRDATITPRLLGRRGVQLAGEFRYLYRPDRAEHPQQGRVEMTVLPADRRHGNDRAALELRHDGRPAPGWEAGVRAAWVSDDDYLRDFGASLDQLSTTALEREARLAFQSETWSLRAFTRYLQSLDGNRPYQALPQVELAYAPAVHGPLRYGLRGELVRYDRARRPDGLNDVTGSRLDLQPWLGLEWRHPWGYLAPRLAWRHTAWSIDDGYRGDDPTPTRTLPVASFAAGLRFERPLGDGARQTLEPRLYYLRVPRRNQAGLIRDRDGSDTVFDSRRPRFSFDELFRDNRYTGADRAGDANRLSVALTSRWIGGDGTERLRLDLGQAFHFDDREVSLPGEPVARAGSSPLVAELHGRATGGIHFAGALHWDADQDEVDFGALTAAYRPDANRLLRVAYRYDRTALEQLDLAAAWPVTARWHLVGRWSHSLRADTRLETFAGIEYKSCCWATRALLRETVRDLANPDDRTVSVLFQLELKGLSRFGEEIGQFLEAAIPGYRDAD